MARPTPPLNVLLIEDEAILVMDLEGMVADAGHQVIGDVASIRELEQWDCDTAPDLVLIDVQLAEDTSGLDASKIVKTRWADSGIVFVTANPTKVPKDHAGSFGVIAKPFSRQMMIDTLAYLAQGICDPPPTRAAPNGFVAFSNFGADSGANR
jgi:AmiR/NasT family two-component response regulator